ncbi:flagellar transcriptional regulator FlhD [Pigmentiphaga litoralis]|jgi:flagellar transcriptional activator FlhD|nr:flagellar transcriptional regulator FlhD [Pigmentiphaga litoralis]
MNASFEIADAVSLNAGAVPESSAMSRLNAEIRDANLTYLLLAQQMLRIDRAEALFRLGLSSEVGDLVESLTTAQLIKIASTTMLLARFRFDDSLVWNLLATPKRDDAPSRMHAAILMASRTAAAA